MVKMMERLVSFMLPKLEQLVSLWAHGFTHSDKNRPDASHYGEINW